VPVHDAKVAAGAGPQAPVGPARFVTAWLAAIALPLLVLVLVAPWVRQAFAVWDFGELLPLLRGRDGFLAAIRTLAEYYRADGRANYLTYAQIALTWRIAGDSALAWQAQRAVMMIVPAFLFVLAARRMGAAPVSAGLGGALVILGASAMEGWTLLMGEPLAVALLLGMVLLAVGYRDAARWRGRAALLGVLALAVMQTKEVLGVCIPFVVLLALCHEPGGGLRLPRRDSRTLWLTGSLALSLGLELAILVPALGQLQAEGYAGGYGAEGMGLARVGSLILAMQLPMWFNASGIGSLLYPANAAVCLLLLLAGWRVIRTRPAWLPGALVLGILPVVGAFVYAPWPRYAPFYGMPFWFGGAGLIVAGGTVLARSSRGGEVAAVLLLATAVGFSAIAADRALKERHAHSALAEALVEDLARWSGVDSVFVVGPATGPRRWPVTGPELRRYAVAFGKEGEASPPILDLSCEEAAARLRAGLSRAALINSAQSCGPLPIRTGLHMARYRFRDWLDLTAIRDSVVLESLVPSLVPRR